MHYSLQTNSTKTWQCDGQNFSICPAIEENASSIADLVNEAYSESDYGYYRMEEGKGSGQRTSVKNVAEKINQTNLFSMFVCFKKASEHEEKDQIVGTIYLKHHELSHEEKAEVCMYAINKDFRGKFKVGPRLLRQVEKEALNHRINNLILDVVDSIGGHNQLPLIEYYKKKGFFLTGEKETISHPSLIQPITLLKMEKILA